MCSCHRWARTVVWPTQQLTETLTATDSSVGDSKHCPQLLFPRAACLPWPPLSTVSLGSCSSSGKSPEVRKFPKEQKDSERLWPHSWATTSWCLWVQVTGEICIKFGRLQEPLRHVVAPMLGVLSPPSESWAGASMPIIRLNDSFDCLASCPGLSPTAHPTDPGTWRL
jgi:hypothetical protein